MTTREKTDAQIFIVLFVIFASLIKMLIFKSDYMVYKNTKMSMVGSFHPALILRDWSRRRTRLRRGPIRTLRRKSI